MSLSLERAPRVRPLQPAAPNILVWREGGWLRFDCSVSSSPQSKDELLALNAAFPGMAGFCLASDGSAHVRLEIPVSGGNAEARLDASRADVELALAALDHGAFSGWDVTDEPEPNVSAICLEAGWRCVEREPRHWAVDLETPFFCQAVISARNSMLRMVVTLAEADAPEPPCAEAISHLLLVASGKLRMVRAGIRALGSRQRIELLVNLPCAHDDGDLPHALCALSVGASQLLREVEAVRDPTLASEYLATTEPEEVTNK